MSDATPLTHEGSKAESGASLASNRAFDPGPPGEAALSLAREVGMTFTVADVLARRGATAGDELTRWLDPKLAHLTPPHEMADLDAITDRISRAIDAGERIAVFGDYDCDGITSATIMTEVIEALGGDVRGLVASRFAGGYGFSRPALERVRETGATLLITCDCGSSDHERLAAAQEMGIDPVVIDHHLVPDETLPAVAFLNPHRPECGFPYKGLASCGLALFVAAALRKKRGAKLDIRRWLDLVAVGTIADVAPLDGDNRALVRAGLKVLAKGERIGLSALAINGCGGRRRPMSAEDVAYQVAPRINAPGRLGDPTVAMDLLREKDPAKAWALAEQLERITKKRRELQRQMTTEALVDVEKNGWADAVSIVLAREDWHPGIVGIVAGRVADQFQKPTVVIALEGANGRGSARTPSGFRLYDALSEASGSLLGFGGHQAAAGVEIASGAVGAFRESFAEACAAQLEGAAAPAPPHLPDVRLDDRDDPLAVLEDLERLEPTGEANPAPKILVSDVEVVSTREIKGHLKLEVMLRNQRIGGFAPEMGDRADGLVGKRVDIVGRLKRDHWRGGQVPELLVQFIIER
jgi:single-stranded-DNA-specific exonuclease